MSKKSICGTSCIFPLGSGFTIRKFGKFRIVSFLQRSFTSEQSRLHRLAERNVKWSNSCRFMSVRSRRSVVGSRNKSGESSGKSGGSTTKELSGRVVEVNVEVIGAGSRNSNELLSEWSVETLSFISSSWS